MSAYYYYGRDEQVTGPVGMEMLRALLEQRRIDEQTQLWSEERDWSPLGEALPQFNPPPPPNPDTAASATPGAATPPALPPPLPQAPSAIVPHPPRHWLAPAEVAAEPGWSTATPHPWRRWLARMIDHYSLGLLGYVVLTVPIYAASSDIQLTQAILANDFLAAMAATLITVPLCAVFIALSGTSPGKWCAGIRVLARGGGRIGLGAALGRELRVWASGMGLGIPLISLITMALAYQTLTSDRRMDWDDSAGAVVHYRDASAVTVIRLIAGVILVLILVGYLMSLGADSHKALP